MNLVADIGGTNARFACVQSGSTTLDKVKVFPCIDFPSLAEAISHYIESNGVQELENICLAVPGPTDFVRIELPNSHWSFNKNELQKALSTPVLVVNDYSAQLFSLNILGAEEFHWLGEARPENKAQVQAILGVGTGLGVAIMSQHGDILPSEGGHVSFAPGNEHETELLKLLWQRFERVSMERILSGPGLSNLYWANSILMGKEKNLTSKEVRDAMIDKDPCALQVQKDFTAILGSFAGDIAINAGALGGVYLSGGVLPKLQGTMDLNLLRQRFDAKGRFTSYCAGIPLALVLAEYPGLVGSARYLSQGKYGNAA